MSHLPTQAFTERALFCGDRNWTDRDMIRRELEYLKRQCPTLTICHGGARGADSIAGEEAEKLGIPVRVFPADWKKHGRAAGPIRNRQMLREFEPTSVHAFHDDIEHSKGTRNMVELAEASGTCLIFTATSARPFTGKPHD